MLEQSGIIPIDAKNERSFSAVSHAHLAIDFQFPHPLGIQPQTGAAELKQLLFLKVDFGDGRQHPGSRPRRGAPGAITLVDSDVASRLRKLPADSKPIIPPPMMATRCFEPRINANNVTLQPPVGCALRTSLDCRRDLPIPT